MLLVADSGSTKTDWRLVDTNGQTRAIQTDGFNPYYQTCQQIAAIVAGATAAAPEDAVIGQVFYYGTGCTGHR